MKGIFNGKIKDYGMSVTKAENPQPFIMFDVYEQNDETFSAPVKTMTWYGSFVGGAKDIALKSLISCGLAPQNFSNLVNLMNGVSSNMLDLNKVLTLDIQEESKWDDATKMVSKIQWVNDPATAPQIKKIDEAKNAQFFSSMGFDGDLIRLAGDMGISLNNGGSNTMGQQNQMNMNNQGQQQNVNQGQNMNQGQQNMSMNQGQNQNMNQGQQMQNNGQQQNMNMNNGQQQNNNAQNNNNVQNNNTNMNQGGGNFTPPF